MDGQVGLSEVSRVIVAKYGGANQISVDSEQDYKLHHEEMSTALDLYSISTMQS